MKKLIRSLLLVAVAAGLATALPARLGAAEKKDEKKEEGKKKEGEKKEGEKKGAAGIPYSGKTTAVDKAGKTFTIPKDRVIAVTATTKIQKGGKPAMLDDLAVGEEVAGQYKKGEGDKLEALSIRIGPKPEGEAKKGEPKKGEPKKGEPKKEEPKK